jgi:hypothetical protein
MEKVSKKVSKSLHASRYTSRGARRFRPDTYSVQSVYKLYSSKTGHLLLPSTQTSQGFSCIERTACSLCKPGEISQCNFKKITRRLHIEMITIKTLRIFISLYSLLKSERLSVGIRSSTNRLLGLYKPMPALHGNSRGQSSFEIAASAKQSSPQHW